MEITKKMEEYIIMALDEEIKEAYPKTGGISVRDTIVRESMKTMNSKKNQLLLRALHLAIVNSPETICGSCGGWLKGGECENCPSPDNVR